MGKEPKIDKIDASSLEKTSQDRITYLLWEALRGQRDLQGCNVA